jgi:hypothetical protein
MLLKKVDKALKKCNGSAPDGEDNPTIKIAHEINKCFA